jgi:hypothetical protein
MSCYRVPDEEALETALHWREAQQQAHCQGRRTDLPP